MDYRPVPESRMQEFENVAHYAFSPEDEPRDSDRVDDPSFDLGDPRALFEEEAMTTVARLLELDARCRDEWITLGGLRSVATPPEYRRAGRAAALIEEALAEFAERGVPLVALWPFEHDFYAGLGWATAAKRVRYRLSPTALAPLAQRESGRSFRPTADEWKRLQRVNVADGEGTSLSLRRTESWWRHREFERSGTKRHVYAWEESGEVKSYVVFTVDAESDRTLRVRDLAAVDDRAFRHLCWVLFNHDSQVERLELTGRPNGRVGELLDRVADPDSVSCELEHGAMVRVADVPGALEAIPYPDEVAGTVTLAVTDDLAAWNDHAFELSFDDGGVQSRRVEESETNAAPDVAVDVGTFSQLVVGYVDVDRAERVGSLTIRNESKRDLLRQAFPPCPVELSEFF